MTNRDYLNTLSDEEFSRLVLEKASEFEAANFDAECGIFDIIDGALLDFEEWLKEEYKENDK